MNIFVPNGIKNQNQNFSSVVDDLEQQFKKDTLSLSQLENQLLKVKLEWFDAQITYMAVQHILENRLHMCMQGELPSKTAKCWKAVHNVLSVSECRAYITSDEETSLLGLSTENLNEVEKQEQEHFNEGKELLQEEVDKHLENACVKLTKLHDSSSSNSSLRIVQARCLHLDELLRNDKEQLNEDQAALEEVQKKMADLSIQYHQELQECCEILMKLLKKYRLQLQPRKDQILLKNALASCETYTAKLRACRMKLKCDTYSEEAVDGLRKLRSEITTMIRVRERESSSTHRQLDEYRQLGPAFEAVVKEYASALSDLEKQQWTLSEIKKKLSSA